MSNTIGSRAAYFCFALAIKSGKNISQVASVLGVNVSVIYGWKKGRSNPSARALARLVELGADANKILVGKEE